MTISPKDHMEIIKKFSEETRERFLDRHNNPSRLIVVSPENLKERPYKLKFTKDG